MIRMSGNKRNVGLLLMGGGARAAYQVGVLSGIREILGESRPNPFQILLGTSAGSLNAAMLAGYARNWHQGIHEMEYVWRTLRSGDVYETSLGKVSLSGSKWVMLFMFGWLLKRRPRSLLNNTPLADTLNKVIRFDEIDASINQGYIDSLAVTASSYNQSGHWVFFQANQPKRLYEKKMDHRNALQTKIENAHLLASCALPFIFPAEPLWMGSRKEYFGDGSIKQTSPLSPLIHLGADKILVIGCETNHSKKSSGAQYPSIGAIAGHSLSSMFYTALETDLAQAEKINQAVDQLDPSQHEKIGFKRIKTLLINPSFSIQDLAEKHAKSLPKPIYTLIKVIGGTTGAGAEIVSYLLFEKEFVSSLIDLGKQDAFAQRDKIKDFFDSQP